MPTSSASFRGYLREAPFCSRPARLLAVDTELTAKEPERPYHLRKSKTRSTLPMARPSGVSCVVRGQFRAITDGGVAGHSEQEQEQVPGIIRRIAVGSNDGHGVLLDGRKTFCESL